MGVLDDLLDGTRARGGSFVQMVLEPPWALGVDDGSSLALVTTARGEAVVVVDGHPPVTLAAGDVALVRGPFTVADDAATSPHLLVDAAGTARWADHLPDDVATHQGPDGYGTAPDGSTVLVSGGYRLAGEVPLRLLDALPRVLVVGADDLPSAVHRLLDDELGRREPGHDLVLDRWLDLALVATVRAWFARPDSGAPGWYAAHTDPAVGRVLTLMHDDPSHPWTLVELAERASLSRAGLAKRFTELVGEPPMGYLTQWRLTLAADLLRAGDDTVEVVARQVGYSSAFALSAAFKRVRGVSPSEHRRGAPDARGEQADTDA
ncbi:AraC family transcriptional regulator [Solicola sp. PLA-1-18]|uniref:AraC family transcriptional regulator n=1 Tax=Solicola sp. PLA-1-18 TaxID=3380532 RepID=UPI003B7E96F9